MSNRPSAEEFAAALRNMEPAIPPKYRKFLQVQYAAPNRSMTARRMAEAVDYENYNAINLHYGKLAKRISQHLGKGEQHNGLLVTISSKDGRDNEWLWTMRPEVAEALEILGWVGSNGSMTDAGSLVNAFIEFKENSQWNFDVRIRRERASQLRNMLSEPNEIDLETFNLEVWRHDPGSYLIEESGERVNLNSTTIEERNIALNEQRLELHGNQIWGSGAKVFGAGLRDTLEQKTEYLNAALNSLNADLLPIEKVNEMSQVRGFGNNIITGLVMVFHPTEFAIYNKQSRGGVEKLGYGSPPIEAFQNIVADLKEQVEAEDFIELDWFLFQINNGMIKIGSDSPPPPPPVKHSVLNTILFGPPGTGKTYTVQRKAVEVIEPSAATLSDKEVAERFRGYRDEGRIEFVTFHPSFSYEEFVEGFRYDEVKGIPTLHNGVFTEVSRKALENADKLYVLVIDEINRGNISRIFGELITLLETDKRRGAEHELSVTLPYSGENFSVPGNLHVIGTMNTADRSIALLDVALRRRFEFEEMMPRVDVVKKVLEKKGAEPDFVKLICDVFEVLNARITALLDRDHQIGHSYFLAATSADALHHALYRRIFPLLQEYFYNDMEQLKQILGEYSEVEGAKQGFIGTSPLKKELGTGFETEHLWEFHKYEVDELEDALRSTFLEG